MNEIAKCAFPATEKNALSYGKEVGSSEITIGLRMQRQTAIDAITRVGIVRCVAKASEYTLLNYKSARTVRCACVEFIAGREAEGHAGRRATLRLKLLPRPVRRA